MAKQRVGKNDQSKQRLGMCKGREERSKGFEDQKEIKRGEAISVCHGVAKEAIRIQFARTMALI